LGKRIRLPTFTHLSIPRTSSFRCQVGKFNQIKERFQERDLELKQAHLQIQLMQVPCL
jgi:hypothetical protein